MFGYIRPYKPELCDRDYELYKAVYCGLCKQLGDDYGVFARLVLSYDAAFFAMIVGGLEDSNNISVIKKGSCTCNPFKKCGFCSAGDNSLKIASAVSVLSFYYKLLDNERDEKPIKSILAKLLRIITEKWKIDALKNYPEIDKIISNMLDTQFKVEKLNVCSIDRAADPTAKMLSQLMALFANNDLDKQNYSDFGYFLGRWIYLIDAIDDFEKDRKSSAFNPLSAKFADVPNIGFKNEEFKNYCNGLLNQTVARLIASYKLLNISKFNTITDNIIYKGIPEMQRQIIFERKHK